MSKATYLKEKFIELLVQKVTIDTDVDKVAVQNVYDEMLRKLQYKNSRISIIIDTKNYFEQRESGAKGKWQLLDRIYMINY